MPSDTSKDTNHRQRGGARPGAGRKPKSASGEPLNGGEYYLRLTPSQETKVQQLAEARGDKEPQDAIRALIDEAPMPAAS